VRVARIFLLAALLVAYGTGSFAQSSALVAPQAAEANCCQQISLINPP